MLLRHLSIANLVLVRLTARRNPRYSPTMRSTIHMIVLTMFLSVASGVQAMDSAPPEPSARVPTEDYSLYDLIVDEKFLTPDTQLVLLERTTVTRLHPEQQEPLRLETFQEYDIFDGRLPLDLLRDFVFKNQTSVKLDKHFGFGVRYRFISGEGGEQQETSLAPVPVFSVPFAIQDAPLDEPPPIIDRLGFSRVGYTFGRDQALVYVEYNRPDGTGAGFAVWLNQAGKRWGILESELVWAARPQ